MFRNTCFISPLNAPSNHTNVFNKNENDQTILVHHSSMIKLSGSVFDRKNHCSKGVKINNYEWQGLKIHINRIRKINYDWVKIDSRKNVLKRPYHKQNISRHLPFEAQFSPKKVPFALNVDRILILKSQT